MVGKIINDTQTPLTIGEEVIAPESGKVFAFTNGLLPEVWKCTAKGYDPIDLKKDHDERTFDGYTITIGKDDLKPRAVEMRLPNLEDGVSCRYSDQVVMQSLRLRPGNYVCRYTRLGYEDQDISFAVLFDTDGTLPQPQSWRAKPIRATVPLLGEGIVCRVDERIVTGVVLLRPGEYDCFYERPDYKPQAKKFSVVAGVDVDLPPPGKWEQTEGLKNLVLAQKAIDEKKWETADSLLKAADVVSDENRKQKAGLVAQVEKHVKMLTNVAQAEVFFRDGVYHPGVKLYYETAMLGYNVPGKKKEEILKICDKEIARLTKQIEKYRRDSLRNYGHDIRDAEGRKEDFSRWKGYFSR